MSTASGWIRRKAPLRAQEQRNAPAEEESAGEDAPGGEQARDESHGDDAHDQDDDGEGNDDDGYDQNDEPPLVRRRRNRVSFALSDASSSSEEPDDEAEDQGNEGDTGGGGAIDRLLHEDDSGEDGNESGRGDSDVDADDHDHNLRVELGLEDDDEWNVLPADHHHHGILNFQRFGPLFRRGHEIALHLADADAAGGGRGGDEEANVVDLQNTQNDEGLEIDLTALSSDSEGEVVMRGVGGNDDDDDDEVEIVGSNAAPLLPVGVMRPAATPRGGASRKRRRHNDAGGDVMAANRPFDTQRAESTNVSLENNETVERFKAALKCSVCLEVIEDMTSTICGHVYCAKCIRLAIRVTQKCPLCQRPLRPIDIHGLYF